MPLREKGNQMNKITASILCLGWLVPFGAQAALQALTTPSSPCLPGYTLTQEPDDPAPTCDRIVTIQTVTCEEMRDTETADSAPDDTPPHRFVIRFVVETGDVYEVSVWPSAIAADDGIADACWGVEEGDEWVTGKRGNDRVVRP